MLGARGDGAEDGVLVEGVALFGGGGRGDHVEDFVVALSGCQDPGGDVAGRNPQRNRFGR